MTTNERNVSALIHLSALTQYFFPFGNYLFPIVIWSSKKNDSAFIDYNGKQVLNFQLSMLLYTLVMLIIAVPTFIFGILKNMPIEATFSDSDMVIDRLSAGNITGIVILALTTIGIFFFLKVFEFILIIYGAVKASGGESYRYPLSISFFK